MPTQMEVEYWRNQYQRMNAERFLAANAIGLITHTLVSVIEITQTNSFFKYADPTY